MPIADANFWTWLIGFDPDAVPTGADVVVEFARFGRNSTTFLLLLAGAVGIGIVLHSYWRTPGIGRGAAAAMAGLRVVMLALIVAALFEPRLTVVDQVERPATTVVLLDRSASMELADDDLSAADNAILDTWGAEPAAARTRFAIAQAMLRAEKGRLPAALAAKNSLRVYTFDTEAVPIVVGEASAGTELRGGGTDIANAIAKALADLDAADETLAGVLLITDGRRTVGESPDAWVAELVGRDAPVIAVALGTDVMPANVQITAVLGPDRMFKDDPAAIDVALRNIGCTGTATLSLVEKLANGSERLIETREIALDPATIDRTETFTFTHETNSPLGRRVLEARLSPLPDETTDTDNVRGTPLEIIDRRARMLLIAGTPTHEYRFLKNMLLRERTIEVSCWLQSSPRGTKHPGDLPIAKLPATTAEFREYDAIVLLDPDWQELGENFAVELEDFVAEFGAGLLLVPGESHFARYLVAHTKQENGRDVGISKIAEHLLDWLPIVPDLARANVLNAVHVTPLTLAVTPEGREHPVSRITHDPARLAPTWFALPPIRWALPVRETKPGAAVLIRHAHPMRKLGEQAEAVLAVHSYGTGRVVCCTSDDTWRWRSVAESYYERYWIQLCRYLIESRANGGRSRMQFFASTERALLGEPITLTAEVLDAAFEPARVERVTAHARFENGRIVDVPLDAVAGRPGWFSGELLPPMLGLCEVLLVNPTAADEVSETATVAVQVERPQIEIDNPTRDLPALKALVGPTGGRIVPLAEVFAVADDIPSRRRILKSPGQPQPLWAVPLMLIVALLLLSAEWLLRKRSQLV